MALLCTHSRQLKAESPAAPQIIERQQQTDRLLAQPLGKLIKSRSSVAARSAGMWRRTLLAPAWYTTDSRLNKTIVAQSTRDMCWRSESQPDRKAWTHLSRWFSARVGLRATPAQDDSAVKASPTQRSRYCFPCCRSCKYLDQLATSVIGLSFRGCSGTQSSGSRDCIPGSAGWPASACHSPSQRSCWR